MQKRKSHCAQVVVILLACSTLTVGASHAFADRQWDSNTIREGAEYVPDELLVQFTSKANGAHRTKTEKVQILQSLGGGSFEHHFSIVPGLTTVKLPAGLTVEKALKTYNNHPNVIDATPNYISYSWHGIPNDTYFDDELWGMHNIGNSPIYGGIADSDIDAPEAWDITHDAGDIIVAVIDSGIDYTHPDLAANMWVNEAEFYGIPGVDDDEPNNGYIDDIYGYDFGESDSDPYDESGHGTHIAGTIGAVGNNNLGVTGTCWNVKIMAVKTSHAVYDEGPPSRWFHPKDLDDIIKGIEYAVDNGAKILVNAYEAANTSFFRRAIAGADANEVLFIATAGNDSKNLDHSSNNNKVYPASYDLPNIISVMATTSDDTRWSDSSWGAESVDIAAPGKYIYSTLPWGYGDKSGTSMAAPHVAGACALVWSMFPDLTHYEVRDRVLGGVDRLGSLNDKCVTEGRLNLYKAVTGVQGFEFSMEQDRDPNLYPIDPYDSYARNFTLECHILSLQTIFC